MNLKSLIKTKLFIILKKEIDVLISINVSKPGTLFTLVASSQKKEVTNLILSGIIDARDVRFLRDELPKLRILDMRAVTIRAYNGNSGPSKYSILYPANEMPQNSFYDCYGGVPNTVLTSIILPSTLTRVGYSAFFKCTSLSEFILPNNRIHFNKLAIFGCSNLLNNIILKQFIFDGVDNIVDNTIKDGYGDHLKSDAINELQTA